jgi:pimeloyl-ACP methyl ester carboxylesterase
MTSEIEQPRKPWWRRAAVPGALVLLAVLLWSSWAELNPQQERELRTSLQEQLEERFPDALAPANNRYGLTPPVAGPAVQRPFRAVLVHGLDEPGDIWADLLPVLTGAGFESREFRYPNDQGIDLSADLLAASWAELPADLPVVLIGHSMGGLVIRDFVTRYRHPVGATPQVDGAAVAAVILVGTPNQGSDWARMRVWLELRDQWAAAWEQGFSPLAGLQDGTGAAKIDLQPGSDFLLDLNARPWPETVPLHIIGGQLLPATPSLGDGVVAVEALLMPGAPPPQLVTASHRGMLLRLFESDEQPLAIPLIISILEEL